jgi:hypothetical protein
LAYLLGETFVFNVCVVIVWIIQLKHIWYCYQYENLNKKDSMDKYDIIQSLYRYLLLISLVLFIYIYINRNWEYHIYNNFLIILNIYI